MRVNQLRIPEGEFEWKFSPSGGPGGQHANRSSTRAELRFDLGTSPSVPVKLREEMLERLGGRAPRGVVTVVADESRSQWRNRQAARSRMADLLSEAMRRPKKRRPTATPGAVRKRRLEAKRRRGDLKRLRRRPDLE